MGDWSILTYTLVGAVIGGLYYGITAVWKKIKQKKQSDENLNEKQDMK